jgi:hypothetical protein
VLGFEPLADKWAAFGWHVQRVDGNDLPRVVAAFVGAVGELMAVGDGKHIGPAERLADVALALHLAHAQGETADAMGARGKKR